MNIAHALSVQSDFSIGESLLQVDHIIDKAKEFGYESVALTDTMSIHQLVDFSNRAKKAGIKPIIGCRLRVYDDPTCRKPARASSIAELPNQMVILKVYVADARGITSLLKLLSKANSKEYFYYHSRCGWKDVFELEGVAVSTGDFYSLWHHPEAEVYLARLRERFKTFVELVPINTPLFDTLNARAIAELQRNGGMPLVTYPTLYREDADAPTLEVLNAIATQSKMSVPYRPKQFVTDFGFREPKALALRVMAAHQRTSTWGGISAPDLWRSGLTNIEKLAGLCVYQFEKMPVSLPVMAINEFGALGRKCIDGWRQRLVQPVLGYKPAAADLPRYQERLQYELSVLKKMGFSGYFLLVEDLVTWAKENQIIVGPGRGSIGGSLVAYLLGITDVDPIRFNLLFERFINPERLDLPDADLDFMSSRRDEIITYLQNKYGADRVAGISNFSTLASASALRDAGRVHELSNLDLAATKLVPKEHGQSVTLTEAAKAVAELDKFKEMHPAVWDHAIRLEGVMRSFGRHAAGVVIAGEPLISRCVVETRESDDGVPVTNWDKRVVEDFGLVKMDILGLSTLDVLEIARRYIKQRHGRTVDYAKLPLEEKDIMESFGRGDTTGVFQFESKGMVKLLRDLAVGGRLSFEDITAATALYRPGPMDSGLMQDFVQIKQGNRSAYYDHPNMEAALQSTYSVIVYQEQVMQLAVDLAGFTRADADLLRKAMGKKDRDKMATLRDQWVAGCARVSDMSAIMAGGLFDKVEMFAGYGFNKSHATAYSIISYWTMWARVRYPAEYFAACLSVVGDDRLTGLVNDARKCGIELLPPDVNHSTEVFTIPDDHHLLMPFSKLMGCSENTARRLVELREAAGGSFADMDHFIAVVAAKGSKVNSKVRDNLEKVGGLVALQPGVKPARDPSRRRDQMELLPGLIVDAVKAERVTDLGDGFVRAKIIHIIEDYRGCSGCDLAGEPHPQVRMKNKVKFMVVTDCPTWQEESKDKLMEGDAAIHIKNAIKAAGLSVADGYYTTLVKAKKNDKFLSNAQLNGCAEFLSRELELVRPAIIIALGAASIRRFIPGLKVSPGDMVGKVIFDPKLDASIVCGLNPQQIHFDPAKAEMLDSVFQKVAEILD